VHIPSRCILTPSNRLRGSTHRRHSLPLPHKAKTGPTSTVAKSISRFQARAFRSWHRLPPNLHSLQAESVDVAVVRANINQPIRHGRRGVNSTAGGVAPQLRACLGAQRAPSTFNFLEMIHAKCRSRKDRRSNALSGVFSTTPAALPRESAPRARTIVRFSLHTRETVQPHQF
jgi:hypothetical protein